MSEPVKKLFSVLYIFTKKTMSSLPVLAIVVPCYNEEAILQTSVNVLSEVLSSLVSEKLVHPGSFICLVDDGSKDATWDVIHSLVLTHSHVKAIKLSANFGHQNALLAGLFQCAPLAGCFLTLDADLQDDVSVIPSMLKKYSEGYQIVYGVRKKRASDSWMKRTTARMFYKLMQVLGVRLVPDHADFRLISKTVLLSLQRFQEVNLFLRGIFPLMGFRHCEVYYDRVERIGGESKYSWKKMFSLAFDGVSSFSVKPLRMVTLTGVIVFFLSLLASCYALWGYFTGRTLPGWLSIVVPFYLLGGLQILCLGILGEYLGKIYKETKRRPRYIVEETRGFEQIRDMTGTGDW